MTHIPLLSGRALEQFSPEEFHAYVRGLKQERIVSRRAEKKRRPAFSWRLSPKKGTLTVKVSRTPKWLSHGELDVISAESGKPLNEVFAVTKRLKIFVHPNHTAAEVMKRMTEIPF